jgi:phage-related protein
VRLVLARPSCPSRRLHTVIYDPDAVVELVAAVKAKEERRAIFNAVEKLREVGELLAPPHMKPLQGKAAGGLRELRPRQGRSDWRALYRRYGSVYVILAFDRHDNFPGLVERAQARAALYVCAWPGLDRR